MKPIGEYKILSHTASGAWQVASIAYTASNVLSGIGIFMKSACIIKYDDHVNDLFKSISSFNMFSYA